MLSADSSMVKSVCVYFFRLAFRASISAPLLGWETYPQKIKPIREDGSLGKTSSSFFATTKFGLSPRCYKTT